MEDFFPKRKKTRELAQLQLAPLIDIFVLIVFFLIKGTVLGGTSLNPPEDLKPALSKSPEGIEPAGQIYVGRDDIHFVMINQKMPIKDFIKQVEEFTPEAMTGQAAEIVKQLKTYLGTIPESDRKSGILLNLLADASVPYRTVFETSKFFRQLGFQNILFVAEGDKE